MTDLAGYNDIVPPSTGKKKKARKVFGNILSNVDLNHSLSYTPSPFKSRKNDSSDDDGETKHSSKVDQHVVTTLFCIAESNPGGGVARSVRSTEDGRRKSENSCSLKSTACRSETSTVVVCRPFSKIIGDDSNKENGLVSTSSIQQIPSSIRVPSDKYSVDSKLSLESVRTIKQSDSSNIRGFLTLPSSIRHGMMITPNINNNIGRKTGHSVNQALNAAKRAKERDLLEKAKSAATIRGQLKEDKEEALDFYEESEKMRREQLNLQNQLSSQFSKAKARRNMEQRQVQREETEKESIFKSTVAREQQLKLKEKEDMRRRQSIAVRAKIRENNRQGEEKLTLMKIEEEKVIFEERQSFSQAQEQYQKERLESARKNFQFRRGDALRIRELHNQMETQHNQETHESYELMFAAAKDAEEYRLGLAEQRRQSLASRNAAAREQRLQDEAEQNKEKQAERKSYELKWAAESDAEKYKRQLEEKRRASLAFRNKEGRKHREIMGQQQTEHLASEHESYMLKFEADKDAEAYARQQALLRRKSLEQRNQMASEIREHQAKEEAEQLEREHASWELKFAGDKDAEEYLRKMKELRRKSLQQRSLDAIQQREEDEKRQAQVLELEHKSVEMKWDGERDAQAYLGRLEEERRKSLESRNREAQNQRMQAEAQRTASLEAEHESYELKWAAEKDAEEYQKKVEKERRDSLAFRNKERARHAKVMEELNSLAREQEAESLALKMAAENDAKEYLAQLDEERRKSLQFRNREARRQSEIVEEMRRQQLVQAHKDEVLNAAGQKDVEKYRKECAERSRASLEFRGKEVMVQRLEESNRMDKEREEENKNLELETHARQDVEEYLRSCKSRRRKSLALRAKEGRRHAEWLRKEEQRQLYAQINDARLRARDSRSMQLARQKERTQQALEALRHANCTFSSFPIS